MLLVLLNTKYTFVVKGSDPSPRRILEPRSTRHRAGARWRPRAHATARRRQPARQLRAAAVGWPCAPASGCRRGAGVTPRATRPSYTPSVLLHLRPNGSATPSPLHQFLAGSPALGRISLSCSHMHIHLALLRYLCVRISTPLSVWLALRCVCARLAAGKRVQRRERRGRGALRWPAECQLQRADLRGREGRAGCHG